MENKNIIQKYFSQLLFPLKETSLLISYIFSTIAQFFDIIFETYYKFIQKSFSQYGHDIENFAKERGIIRLSKESDHNFQQRVLNAFSFNKTSSSKIGIMSLIQSVINKPFTIRELYKERWILGKDTLNKYTILGNSNSIAYYFIVDFGTNSLSFDEKSYLEDIINMYKPAYVRFHISAFIDDDWIIGDVSEKLGINTYL